MPTTVIKTVDPDGTGDYTSLSAAEAAEQRDLVAADEIAVFECKSSAGTADTTAVTVTGWTTDATRYVIIRSSGANFHGGAWNTNKYRLEAKNGLTLTQAYTRVQGLQIKSTVGDFNSGNGVVLGDNCRCEKSIIRFISNGTGSAYSASNFVNDSSTGYFYNNLVLIEANDNAGTIIGFAWPGGAATAYVENNTVINVTGGTACHGLDTSGSFAATRVARNNVVKGFGNTNSYVGIFDAGTDNNTTDSTDDIGTGSNNHISQTFTFTNAGAGDYSLASGDTGARDQGTTLATVTSGFTDDIVGTARDGSGAIDCGCYEFPSGVAIPVFMNQYRQRR